MSCRRVQEIDLLAYLAEPRAGEFAEFRAHYPGCPECAAEIRAWTELELSLGADEHPTPERLAAVAGGTVSAAERAPLEAHLARCAPCRDEIAGLRRFASAPALEASAKPAPEPRPGWWEGLRRLVWSPALAYALVAALLAPGLFRALRSAPEPAAPPLVGVELEADERKAPERVARERALVGDSAAKPVEAPEAEPARRPDAAPAPESRLAERFDSAPTPQGRAAAPRPPPESFAADVVEPRPEPVSPPAPAPGLRAAPEPSAAAGLRAAPQAELRARLDERAPAEPSPELELSAGRTLRIALSQARAGLWLGVPLPGELPPGGAAEIRIASADGARELRERHTWSEPPRALAVSVPPQWLRPGLYRTEVVLSPDGPRRVLLFEVSR